MNEWMNSLTYLFSLWRFSENPDYFLLKLGLAPPVTSYCSTQTYWPGWCMLLSSQGTANCWQYLRLCETVVSSTDSGVRQTWVTILFRKLLDWGTLSVRQKLSDTGVTQDPRFQGSTLIGQEGAWNRPKNCLIPSPRGYSQEIRSHITGAQHGVWALWERKGGRSHRNVFII